MKISDLGYRIKTVSSGPRFGHFFIDGFCIEIISYLIHQLTSIPFSGLIELIIFPLYYVFFEFIFQRTPGKFITKTLVINDYGYRPDIESVILRTFIRFVPFEAFSCLDERSWGWHDKWTKTYVVADEDLPHILNQIGANEQSSTRSKQTTGKNKRRVIIFIIMAIFSLSVYGIFIKIRKFINTDIKQHIEGLSNINQKAISGKWYTDWELYSSLNFLPDNQVIATNQFGDEIELSYLVNFSTLTIKDDNGLELKFLVLKITDSELILRDIARMTENITFVR